MGEILGGCIVGVAFTALLYQLREALSIAMPWRRAWMSGAKVSMLSIVSMKLRGCPPAFLVDVYCALVHSGHDVTIKQVESCYIAHKHEFPEENTSAFIEQVKEFAAEHPADESSSRRD